MRPNCRIWHAESAQGITKSLGICDGHPTLRNFIRDCSQLRRDVTMMTPCLNHIMKICLNGDRASLQKNSGFFLNSFVASGWNCWVCCALRVHDKTGKDNTQVAHCYSHFPGPGVQQNSQWLHILSTRQHNEREVCKFISRPVTLKKKRRGRGRIILRPLDRIRLARPVSARVRLLVHIRVKKQKRILNNIYHY